MTPSPSSPDGVDTSRAADYWNQILDPNNLEQVAGEGSFDAAGIWREILFAQTPDLAAARQWLAGAAPAWIIDLGAGLGANAFALAEAGHTIVAVDTSPARLKALRARARMAGVADRIRLVVGSAESLPFASDCVPALFTKSVLIHTRFEVSAAEIARTLAPGGRAALVEPGVANPFVNLYRATLAPKAWQAITRYFNPAIEQIYLQAPGVRPPQPPVERSYYLGFFAFVFMFALPSPPL
jgi:ubiquinone/menaquinone biosynthesis C-methylase UbiE